MITLHYYAESNQRVEYEVLDWDAVHVIADDLVRAPIDLDHLYYQDSDSVGVFCLQTFERL